MEARHHMKWVHEGDYVAQADVELIDTDRAWAPYLSLSDSYKLDDVREAFRGKDIRRASHLARVFTLTAVAV